MALLVMLAVAFGALAPAVAQVLVAERGQDATMQVCTSTGMLMMVLADGDRQPVDDNGAPAELHKQCPWCSAVHAPAAWPATELTLPLLPRAQERPVAFYHVVPTPAIWRGALTRAPPALRG